MNKQNLLCVMVSFRIKRIIDKWLGSISEMKNDSFKRWREKIVRFKSLLLINHFKFVCSKKSFKRFYWNYPETKKNLTINNNFENERNNFFKGLKKELNKDCSMTWRSVLNMKGGLKTVMYLVYNMSWTLTKIIYNNTVDF